MEKALSVSNLRKTFACGKKTVCALKGVDLDVSKGEIFGFLGPNGAGKTTTLKILTTLLPFDEGSVFVAGLDIKKDPHGVRRRIGYVSQTGGADRKGTGWENLILQGRLYGLPKKEAEKRAAALVDTFSLSECIERIVSTYSGGQMRRLDIALGMMHSPEILFLDEPTNGLDPQNRANLWAKILKLKEEGITIFLTSHYLDEIDALADTLAIMDHGEIVAKGTPASLKKEIAGDIVTLGIARESHAFITTLLENEKEIIREIVSYEECLHLTVDKKESALPLILRLLDQSRIPLETVQMATPSLNDVFLKKTGRSLREGASS